MTGTGPESSDDGDSLTSTTTALKVAGREVGPVRRSPGELVDTLIVGRDLELAELRAVIPATQCERGGGPSALAGTPNAEYERHVTHGFA